MCDRLRPSLPALAAGAALAALELLYGDHASGSGPQVSRADFAVSTVAVLVSSALSFLGGLFRGRVDLATKMALEGLRGSIGDIGRWIVDGLAWVGGKLTGVLNAVKRFIQRTFGRLFDMLRNLVNRVARILDRILGPIIDFLNRVREHVWGIYRDFVKPILDIIEFIRFPLRILSAFGVEWARRLDATLANLEDWIADNFRLVMGRLNQAISFLNEIVDVGGLLKRITLVRSIGRDLDALSIIFRHWRIGPNDPTADDRRRQRLNERTIVDVQRDTETVILTGGGPYGPLVREMTVQWRIYIERAVG